MENVGNARITSGNLGSRSHACPKLPLLSGCEVGPSSLMDSMNKVLIRKFQSELSVGTSPPLSQQKSAVVLQRAQSRPQTGVGELKFHLITVKTAQISLAGNENRCVVFCGGEREDINCSRSSHKGFFNPLFLFPVSCYYNVVLSPVSPVSRLLYFL